MASEQTKDFNAMLDNPKDIPKIKTIIDEKSIIKYGCTQMLLAPPLDYDKIMKKISLGKVITINKIRDYLAKQYNADFTDPITAGIFVSIAAWTSHQRTEKITPYWRTLKAQGALHEKYPGGFEKQKTMLEKEGHQIIAQIFVTMSKILKMYVMFYNKKG